MANMAKRAQAIRVDVNAREKVAKMLDNRKIMDQCRCMHRDERNGIALKSNGDKMLLSVSSTEQGRMRKSAYVNFSPVVSTLYFSLTPNLLETSLRTSPNGLVYLESKV